MLINSSTKQIISKKTKIANTSFLRFKGLMFEKKENFNYALIFELNKESKIGSSVHMMFVFFPIDIVFLDSEKKVVDIVTLNPWKLNYTPKKPAKYFIELEQGKTKEIKIGDGLVQVFIKK